MGVQVLVLKEAAAGERRVAATPETVKKLVAATRRRYHNGFENHRQEMP